MRPNTKILETISRRVEARATAQDANGLRAIIAAAENGLQLAKDALAELEPDPTPASVTEHPKPSPDVLADKREEIEREKYEKRILEQMQRDDASKLYGAIMAQGGIRVSTEDLREEYRNIPKSYRRPDGLPGDQMAEHLATHLPELGITSENELLAYFSERTIRARNDRAA
jgi:hypothetical protein